jgi:hypothetical protein
VKAINAAGESPYSSEHSITLAGGILISPVPSMALAMDSSIGPIQLSITSFTIPADQVNIAVHSSDQTLVSDSGVVISGSGEIRMLTVTPVPGHCGNCTITVLATGAGDAASVTFDLAVSSNQPNLTADWEALTTSWNTPLDVALAGRSSGGGTLLYEIVDPPISGSISGIGNLYTYTPALGFSGQDQFSYRVTVGTASSAKAYVSIYVDSAPTCAVTVDDSDGDGLPNTYEMANGMDQRVPDCLGEDPDHDGLSTSMEYRLGTNPVNSDTDGDGDWDGVEVSQGGEPLDPEIRSVTRYNAVYIDGVKTREIDPIIQRVPPWSGLMKKLYDPDPAYLGDLSPRSWRMPFSNIELPAYVEPWVYGQELSGIPGFHPMAGGADSRGNIYGLLLQKEVNSCDIFENPQMLLLARWKPGSTEPEIIGLPGYAYSWINWQTLDGRITGTAVRTVAEYASGDFPFRPFVWDEVGGARLLPVPEDAR